MTCSTEHLKKCHRFFCRRGGVVEEPASEASGQREQISIPSVLMEPAARRLRYAAGVAALLWAGFLIFATDFGRRIGWEGAAAGVGALVLSLLMVAFTRGPGLTNARLTGVGSAYMMLMSLGLAISEFSDFRGASLHTGASWSAVWIVLFPLLVPCGPKKTLIKTMLAASLTPLAFFLLVHLRGFESPPAAELAMLFAPVYVAGAVAFVASHMLIGLGTQVSNARQMGMYELDEPIGHGGMGEIWRAKHQLLSRPAAVKLVKPKEDGSGARVMDKVSQQRFEREAQVTANLQSPHTVQLYDFGVTQTGTFYYVMELLDGVDLEGLIDKEGPIAPKRVVRILTQTLDSLAEAHAHGLVHRDIKPANIHLSRRGLRDDYVKVLDFGLVKLDRQDEGRPNLTAENSITGTPAYLAPEVVTGEGAVDGRADLYALGAVAYYLLTGKLVFEGKGAMQMAIAHVTESPIPPSQRTEQKIPKALEKLVLQCLEKDPEARPESALSLLRLLEALDLEVSEQKWVAPRSPADAATGALN